MEVSVDVGVEVEVSLVVDTLLVEVSVVVDLKEAHISHRRH